MRYVLDINKCKFIGKGHEGRVYLTPEGFALKIFYKTTAFLQSSFRCFLKTVMNILYLCIVILSKIRYNNLGT